MEGNQNGWNEYSKLVLKELETLASGIDGLRAEISDLKQQLVEMKAREDRVEDLREWKAKIDEIASPSQLRELTNEVDSLKLFKTKAVTIFMVVQAAMASAIALMKFFV